MRRLNKGEPSAEFTQYIDRYEPKSWKEFSENCGVLKQEITFQMLDEEQDYLCGYTELIISDLKECHIDHFRKRAHFPAPDWVFDWDNFVVAVKDEEFGAKHKDGANGIKKNEYDLILNPVIDNAETYFEYTTLGEIIPKRNGLTKGQESLALKTIEIFNLDHPSLRFRRADRITTINSLSDSGFSKDEIISQFENLGFKSVVEQYTQGK